VQKDEAIFKVAKSVILFKRMILSDFEIFFLFLLDNEAKKEIINKKLPQFLEQTQDLLVRYIS
jgi:hypothetical protein